jgi:hypothetical protein
VCFKCGQRGHWASDCKATQSISDAIDLTWSVTSSNLLDPNTDALPRVLRPQAAQAIGLSLTASHPPPTHQPSSPSKLADAAPAAGAASTSVGSVVSGPGAQELLCEGDLAQQVQNAGVLGTVFESVQAELALTKVLKDDFGFQSFRSFQLPVVRAILRVRFCRLFAWATDPDGALSTGVMPPAAAIPCSIPCFSVLTVVFSAL